MYYLENWEFVYKIKTKNEISDKKSKKGQNDLVQW